MRCRKCGQKAVINMRQHKLALCCEHFLQWVPEQTERFIQKYKMFARDERVLLAVSGGKDSLALWDILLRLGFAADGLYIELGIDGDMQYGQRSQACARKFADAHGAHLITVDVHRKYGATIPELAQLTRRGKDKPCSVCGVSKRYIMNYVAREGGYAVLLTGHNLDDEAAVLFQNTLHWQTGYLARQAPVLPATDAGFVRKVKPLCRFYERETAAYALLRGIDYLYAECPFSVGANTIYYKELLGRLEAERPGSKLQFYLSFLQAREDGYFAGAKDDEGLRSCERCGQPTTAPGSCAFCRMWAAVRLRKWESRGGAENPVVAQAGGR